MAHIGDELIQRSAKRESPSGIAIRDPSPSTAQTTESAYRFLPVRWVFPKYLLAYKAGHLRYHHLPALLCQSVKELALLIQDTILSLVREASANSELRGKAQLSMTDPEVSVDNPPLSPSEEFIFSYVES